jgi:AP-2 complex subunit alpha
MKLTLVLINRSQSTPLSSINVFIPQQLSPAFTTDLAGAPSSIPSVIAPGAKISLVYRVECVGPFDDAQENDATYLEVGYTVGGSGTLGMQELSCRLKLPLVVTKFMVPVAAMSSTDFFARWKQIGGGDKEAQVVLSAGVGRELLEKGEMDRRVSGLGLGLLEGIDPSSVNIVAAGILICKALGKVGCMVRIEVSAEHKVCSNCSRTIYWLLIYYCFCNF